MIALPYSVLFPKTYRPLLGVRDTQVAIKKLKDFFENALAKELDLVRVSAPLFVRPETGLNDNLTGAERPVSFDVKGLNGGRCEIVQSLAKWKRMALQSYGFRPGEGLYTDMNAIRRDEELDNLHSIYVDQWDWERVIDSSTRTLAMLKETVQKIVDIICDTQDKIVESYPGLTSALSRKLSFVTTQELEDMYPTLSPKERENTYLRKHKTAFIMQIGDTLKSGIKHDGRAPDYDDWTLNGDIVFWSDVLECTFEVSSMGIRVDEKSLDEQLTKAGCDHRRKLPFHAALLAGQLPLTIGGGIGQSRLCMLLLKKAHIGEVQVSVWDKDTISTCQDAGIKLL